MEDLLKVLSFDRARHRRARAVLVVVAVAGALLFAAASASHASGLVQPSITKATTVDANTNGHIDAIDVTFSVPMDQTSAPRAATQASAPGFYVAGYAIADVAWTSSTIARLTLTELGTYDTGATPSLTYNTDGGGALSSADDTEAPAQSLTVTDGAGPVLIGAYAHDYGQPTLFKDLADQLDLQFSEPTNLAGATKIDRWTNLEKAIHFGGAQCADPTLPKYNFPQPQANGPDPIVAPASATDAQSKFVVEQLAMQNGNNTGDIPSTNPIAAVPTSACTIAVDTQNNTLLTDTASPPNVAVATAPMMISIADLAAPVVKTYDANADGFVDGIVLKFAGAPQTSSIQPSLSQFNVSIPSGPDAATATVTGWQAGSDNKTIVLDISLPDGVAWPGDATPEVTYTKPSNGCGISSAVPTPGYFACQGTFDVTAQDGVAPVALSARTLDTNADGHIDAVTVSLTEPLAAKDPQSWTIGGAPATAISQTGRVVTLSFAPGSAPDTGATPRVVYTSQAVSQLSKWSADAAGNQASADVTAADGAAPHIMGAAVQDADTNGSIDTAVLTMSEPVNAPAAAASGFTVDGVPASALSGDSTATLTATFSGVSGTAPKAVAFAPASSSITDAAGNALDAQSFTPAQVADEAGPIGRITVSPSAPIPAGTATIHVTYTEPMDTAAASQPTVTLGQQPATAVSDADHTNGWTADGLTWDGTVSIAPDATQTSCGQPTGCAVSAIATGAKDLAGNASAKDARLDTRIDTMAPAAPGVSAFAADLAAGKSAPADTINMFTDQVSVTASITPGDATDGIAHVTMDGAPLSSSASPVVLANDGTVTAITSFADRAALQSAITEGTHTFGVSLCDAAGNCTASTGDVSVNVDYTPVSVTVATPNGGDVYAGGSTQDLAWAADPAATDLSQVQLDYSADGGATWTAIDHAVAPATTTEPWTVPSVESSNALFRVTTVDANGNEAADASDAAFAIDSRAPSVHLTAPSTSPFVGGTTNITWTATDATIDRVPNPITIEYSIDGAKTWHEIDGGTYDHSNDGTESWAVPSGSGFLTYVRVTASDDAGHTTQVVSAQLARNIGAYVADRYGHVYVAGVGAAPTGFKVAGHDWVRGIATRPDHTGGYVLSSSGKLYPFAIGGAAMPKAPSTRTLSGDAARGIVLVSNTAGYIVDRDGHVYAFGGARGVHITRTLPGTARGLAVMPNHRGGFVLDRNGKLYPFGIGSYHAPATPRTYTLRGNAAAVMLRANGTSGYVLDSYGRMLRFGGAPSVHDAGTSSRAYAKSIVRVSDTSGYWLDGRGALHPWGHAVGTTPARVTTNYARGAAM